MRLASSGNPGESAVLAALCGLGFDVLVPFGDGHPYDLALHLGGRRFLRIQCKAAWARDGCLVFNSLSTDHGGGRRSYEGHADLFGIYFPPLNSVYLVPLDAVARTEGRLRIEPARNNQKRKIRVASDYLVDNWSAKALLGVGREAEVSPAPAPAPPGERDTTRSSSPTPPRG